MLRSDPRVQAVLFVGALAIYITTATSGAFWLDSSELAAAGVTLGIPHAPGHPLYVILSHAASLLPVGSIGFRIALLSALCGAAAVSLLYALTLRLGALAAGQRPPEWAASLPAVAFAISDALWFQSVRAEVYTLHLALALGLLVIAIDWAMATERRVEPLIIGGLLLGLGAGNHHLLLLALTPALALLLLYSAPRRACVRKALPAAFGAAATGLLIYVLLPLRAAQEPLVNYGHPDSLARFVDVVTAKVFTGSVTGANAPFTDNVAGALDMFLSALGPLWVVLGPIGWWLLWRQHRDLGGALLLAAGANLATKLLMVLDPTNPDAAGYFQLTMALTVLGGGVVLACLAHSGPRGRAGAIALVACAIATGALVWPVDRTDLSRFRGPEIVDTSLHDDAPPGALVMSSFFAHHFNGLYQRAVAGYRPDIHTVHQGLEDHIDGGRPFAAAARRRDPTLKRVLDDKLAAGHFPVAAVSDLATRRPVLLEPTLGLPIAPERLRYRGGLFAVRVRPGPAELESQASRQKALLTALGSEAQSQRETLTTVAMTWLPTAVTRLRQGSATGAATALDGIDQLSPGSRWVRALRSPTEALAAAEASGDGGRVADVRARLRNTDFTALFSGGL